MNILILSCGTRNKIIQYFKETINGNGKVFATDCNRTAPALYDADVHYIVPRITEKGFLDVILDICKKEKINGVLSLIDPELSLLAENETRFKEVGTKVIGSDFALCERALDKWKMHQWLDENNYHCALSFANKEEFFAAVETGKIKFPVFVKPVKGSASLSIFQVHDRETVNWLFARNKGLMIQEFLVGQEIGADCYIDMLSGKVVEIFTKKKILMRAGETDKAISFKNEKLFSLLDKFITECGFKGVIDIDIFDVNGVYYISELNPRFGGGYPHAYESGVNFMSMIINNLNGKQNLPSIGKYQDGIVMMKYNEVKIIKQFENHENTFTSP